MSDTSMARHSPGHPRSVPPPPNTPWAWLVPLVVALGGGTGLQALLGRTETQQREVIRDELRPLVTQVQQLQLQLEVHRAEHAARAEQEARLERATGRARQAVVESHLSEGNEPEAIRASVE
ncbi:MAG: hypothetical protein WC683_06365 [bacterium]